MGILDTFGISAEDVSKAWHLLKRSRYLPLSLPQRVLGLRRAARAARSDLLTEYLVHEFPEAPFLQVNGSTYPVAVFRPSEPKRLQPDQNSIIHLDENWHPRSPVCGRPFYWLQRSEIGDENRETFVMKSLEKNPVSLTCGVADFFSCLKSGQALEWEIHQAVAKAAAKRHSAIADVKRRLPLRNALLRRVSDPLTDGEGRLAAVGVSVLLAYADENGQDRLFLRRRGPNSIVYNRGRWHVYPSAMFQAPCRDHEVEFSLFHVLLWEYVEELFDVPDPQDRRSNPKWFYDMAAVQELRKMVSNDSVQLWFTGIAVNMCSLRPEILLLLHVKDASWLARHETGEAGAQAFRFSKEIAISGEAVGKLVLRPALHGTAGDMFQELQFFPDNTVPVGAAGIHLGIEALNSILLPPQAPQP